MKRQRRTLSTDFEHEAAPEYSVLNAGCGSFVDKADSVDQAAGKPAETFATTCALPVPQPTARVGARSRSGGFALLRPPCPAARER